MRYDLTPLHRSTIGFDRLFHLLDQAGAVADAPSYPPYNIEKTGDNAYRITLAVAGFRPEELTLESKESTLLVRGERAKTAHEGREVLFQGIAGRGFERRFQLADYVVVTGASLENGLLHVDLAREVPEAKKPRLIPINGAGARPAANANVIEGEANAA